MLTRNTDLCFIFHQKTADGMRISDWSSDVCSSDLKEIETAPGLMFPAWTYNGRVPGPTLRVTEGDRVRIRFENNGSHPHTLHFHGIHSARMDGVQIGRAHV